MREALEMQHLLTINIDMNNKLPDAIKRKKMEQDEEE